MPEDEKAYLHRVGRTGRAGRTGVAVTFVDWEDITRWTHINTALEFGQPDPLETYSSSKHLFADLNIPEGTKGRIAESKGRVSGLSGDEKSTGARSSRDGKHAGGHSRDGKSGPGHQRGDRNRSRGGSKPHAAGSGEGAPTGAPAETHGDHEHKTPSAGNRNRQRRRTRGGAA